MINKRPLKFYVDKIKNNEVFSFSRYGDGEWIYMTCPSGRTRINKEMDYFPEAAESLRKTILFPKASSSYFYGLQRLALKMFADKIPSTIDWHGSDLFHHASISGALSPLIASIVEKDVVFVGPRYLKNINSIIPYVDFIEIDGKNCYTQIHDILKRIKDTKRESGNMIYSFSAGAFTNIMIYKLYDEMKNNWLIDFGSVWDPYVNQNTRGYHKKMTRDLISINTGG